MKGTHLKATLLIGAILILFSQFWFTAETEAPPSLPRKVFREITGEIKKGETVFEIFKRYKLDIGELYKIRRDSVIASIKLLNHIAAGDATTKERWAPL